MKQETAKKVFSCCGKYLAVDKAAADSGKAIICPSCGKKLVAPVQIPKIIIVKG